MLKKMLCSSYGRYGKAEAGRRRLIEDWRSRSTDRNHSPLLPGFHYN